jgi:hypothetical protein
VTGSTPRVYSVTPTFGFADASNYHISMDVNGYGFTGMDRAAISNYTVNYPITVGSNTDLSMNILDFYNISYYDNSSTFGDNRATIEIGNGDIGYSRDEIVYTYINHFTITRMIPLIVASSGD